MSKYKQERRDDLGGIFFRSSWEANYARYLNFLRARGLVYRWEHEPETFWFKGIKRGCVSYLPDFKVWDSKDSEAYYVEVKGWMDPKSRTKIKRFLKYYPELTLKLVDREMYSWIKSQYSGLIEGWE
jgi:hypothetical protein